MPTVKEIYEFVKTVAPEEMAYDWDHIGLLCGRSDREVKRVMVALDPFLAVCKEAKACGCQLLLTHHPALWDLKTVNDSTVAGEALIYLCESGISAVNAHTNLDCAPGGVNDCLAAALGLENVTVIDPIGTDAQGRPYGLMRGGDVQERSPAEFAAFVKEALHCNGVRYVDGGRPIKRVAVGGGGCANQFWRPEELGYDAFVTSDANYNAFADADMKGFTLIDAGHFETENVVCAYLAEQVQTAFPDVEVLVSKTHHNPVKYL